MATLADATLSPVERRVLEQLVPLLEKEFGTSLRAVWLYGSRARGEPPHEESDIDLLIVSDEASSVDTGRAYKRIDEAATGEGLSPFLFSPHLYTPERVAQRREGRRAGRALRHGRRPARGRLSVRRPRPPSRPARTPARHSGRRRAPRCRPRRSRPPAEAAVPALFGRRGLRPSGVAPNETLTRFTWTLESAAPQGPEAPPSVRRRA